MVIAAGATQVQVKQESRQSMNFTDHPSLPNPSLPRRVQQPRRVQHHQQQIKIVKEAVYRRMPNTRKVWVKDVYATAVDEVLQGMDGYKEGKIEKTVDCCCMTYLGNDNDKKRNSIEKNVQVVRSSGGNVIRGRLRASYKTIKEILIYYQFLFALANLILSILCLFENNWSVKNGDEIYDVIGFALSAVAFVYTSIDAAVHFFTYTIRCKTCYIWRNVCCSTDQKNTEEGCCKDPKESCICKCYEENCEKKADIVRLLITECCFYFLLLLSIFQLIRDYVDHKIDEIPTVDWVLFGIGMAQDLGPVYICRVIVLAASVYSIQTLRNAERKSKEEKDEGKSGICFYLLIVAQAYGQLVIQIMMIFTISATYYHQYNNCSSTANHTLNECYIPSPQLLYMVALGLVNPLVGTFMFLMVCHYWTQNFTITMIFEMISKLTKTGDAGEALSATKTVKDLRDFNKATKNNYKTFSDIKFIRKLQYPFGNPLRIILSMVYTGSLMFFASSAIIALSGIRPPAPDWLYHVYIAEAIFTLIVNSYVMAIAFVWAFIIMVLIFWCILSICATKTSNRPMNGA